MAKTLAILFGVVFLLIGILGFVPALAPNEMLLNIFHSTLLTTAFIC